MYWCLRRYHGTRKHTRTFKQYKWWKFHNKAQQNSKVVLENCWGRGITSRVEWGCSTRQKNHSKYCPFYYLIGHALEDYCGFKSWLYKTVKSNTINLLEEYFKLSSTWHPLIIKEGYDAIWGRGAQTINNLGRLLKQAHGMKDKGEREDNWHQWRYCTTTECLHFQDIRLQYCCPPEEDSNSCKFFLCINNVARA